MRRIQAADGLEALDQLKNNPDVNLVLVDWNMPNMTSIEAPKVTEADAAIKVTPVIMVTSESENSRIVEAIQSSVANYLIKPFDTDILAEKTRATGSQFS